MLLGCVEEAPGGREKMGTGEGNDGERDGQDLGEGGGNEAEDGSGERNK